MNFLQLIFVFVHFVDLNAIVVESSGNLRITRYGDLNKCGKRKRNIEDRRCFRQCKTDVDCRGVKKRCLCDGECGLSCVRVDQSCNKVDEFPNGRTIYNPDNLFGGHLIYECNPGYKLVGARVRICEGDGWWSGSGPTCVREVFCENPPVIANAMANIQVNEVSRYKMGTEVEYQCDIGYSTNYDLNKSVCQSDGNWTEINFQCIKITCEKPADLNNGFIRATDYSYSSVIEYRCKLGYVLKNGDYLRECLITGEWSGKAPTCEPINCGEPPQVQNAVMAYNSTLFKSKVFYKCVGKKFVQDGSINYVECLSNGKWSNDYIPKCLHVNCTLNYTQIPVYGFIRNSSEHQLDYNVYPVGTVLEFECDKSYELLGERKVSCKVNGQWNTAMPACKLDIYCPVIYAPESGLLITTKLLTAKGYPVDTVLQFTCLHGFELQGSNMRKCDQSGRWTGENPICVQPLNTKLAALSESTTSLINEVRNQKGCNIGLSVNRSLLVVVNNKTIENYMNHGKSMNYSCKENSLVQYTAVCVNGSLIMDKKCEELQAVPKSCTTPTKISNGYLKLGSYLNGSKALYRCFSGFELKDGDKELTCVNGQWLGKESVCSKVNCGHPGYLQHGKVMYVGTQGEYSFQPYMTSTSQNKQIKYICDTGFTLTGSSGSTCINGNWKPNLNSAKCVKDKLLNKNFNIKQLNDADAFISQNALNEPLMKNADNTMLAATSATPVPIQSQKMKSKIGSLRLNELSELNSAAAAAAVEINTDENNILKQKLKKANRKLRRLKKHKMLKKLSDNSTAVDLTKRNNRNRKRKLTKELSSP